MHLCESLTSGLRYEPMPPETAERVLAVLLEQRAAICEGGPSLAWRLMEALRTENPDVRARIQIALVFLAEGRKVDQALREWKPMRSDAPSEVEARIAAWRSVWKPS